MVSIPRVAVVIPARDAEPFLDQAVASVHAQTSEDWELVIVDDGSRDRTAELAARWARSDARISVISQEPRGLSAARNAGVAASDGELLQFLDADDALLPDKLAQQSDFLRQHPDCALVYGTGEYFHQSGPVALHFDPPRGNLVSELLTRNFILVDAALVRRRAFERVGGFRERSSCWVEMYGCEDWDLWLRMAAAGMHLEGQPILTVRNRWHPDRMSADELLMKRSALWVVEEATAARLPLTVRQRALLRSQLFYRRCDFMLALLEREDPMGEPTAGEALPRATTGGPEAALCRGLATTGRLSTTRRFNRRALFHLARFVGRLPTLRSRWARRSRAARR